MKKRKLIAAIFFCFIIILLMVIPTCSTPGSSGGGGDDDDDDDDDDSSTTFNLEEKYHAAYTKSISDLAIEMSNDPVTTSGSSKTYYVNGPNSGYASLTLGYTQIDSYFYFSYTYVWASYTTEDGLIINGSLSFSYNNQDGGSFTGTIECSGVASGSVQYNCSITPAGVISGTYIINGVTYDYASGIQTGGGGGNNSTFNLEEKYYAAYTKSIGDLAIEMSNDPVTTSGSSKTYYVNGPNSGYASLTLGYTQIDSYFAFSYYYIWSNYTTEDGLKLNGSLSFSYNNQDGGSFTGTIECSGVASGYVQYNCTISTGGVISGTYTIDGVTYDYATGQQIS